MNAWDELVERCARHRREQLGSLSDQAYDELVLAVRENPTAFLDDPSDQAFYELARALDAYWDSMRGDDALDDDAYQQARERRLSALVAACDAASGTGAACLDVLLVRAIARDSDPDELLCELLDLEHEAGMGDALVRPGEQDLWQDVLERPRLRLRAAVARTCLDGARYRMAERMATSVLDAAPTDPLGARHTCALAYARLEDEAGLDALGARFSRQESPWSHLARTLVLYKLDRMAAARRALRGYDELCPGGAYALLRPTYVEPYMPDRPEVPAGSFAECVFAVREAEPIIADVPDFIDWCQGHDWLVSSAVDFAEKNDFEW